LLNFLLLKRVLLQIQRQSFLWHSIVHKGCITHGKLSFLPLKKDEVSKGNHVHYLLEPSPYLQREQRRLSERFLLFIVILIFTRAMLLLRYPSTRRCLACIPAWTGGVATSSWARLASRWTRPAYTTSSPASRTGPSSLRRFATISSFQTFKPSGRRLHSILYMKQEREKEDHRSPLNRPKEPQYGLFLFLSLGLSSLRDACTDSAQILSRRDNGSGELFINSGYVFASIICIYPYFCLRETLSKTSNRSHFLYSSRFHQQTYFIRCRTRAESKLTLRPFSQYLAHFI
jgi:hypothetical protein